MKKRGWGFLLLTLGIAWFVFGVFIYSALISGGNFCKEMCWVPFLFVVIPSAIMMILSVLFFVKKKF